jgi:hypothetical protein
LTGPVRTKWKYFCPVDGAFQSASIEQRVHWLQSWNRVNDRHANICNAVGLMSRLFARLLFPSESRCRKRIRSIQSWSVRFCQFNLLLSASTQRYPKPNGFLLRFVSSHVWCDSANCLD